MEISSVFGVSKIPGISSRTRRTLISEVPVFSRVITVSILDEMYDFIRDLSNLFWRAASRTVSCCSFNSTVPEDCTETLGRIENLIS